MIRTLAFDGPDGNGGAENARVADRYAEADARRRVHLNVLTATESARKARDKGKRNAKTNRREGLRPR